MLHPAEARERLRQAATEAMRRRGQVGPLTVSRPVDVEVDLYGPYTVDLATLVPGFARGPGARTVTFTGRDMLEAYRGVQLLVQLGQIKPG